MPVLLYIIFLFLFNTGIRILSLFHPKARLWVKGRKNILEKIAGAIDKPGEIIWIHCASLGEFEQGRPLIEKLRPAYPRFRILLTFFSPSGYEAQKNYPGADWVFYLPMDGPGSARKFLAIVEPTLVIFVKYEFWYYYLKKIKYRNIPLILVSALFRVDMSFFKWYGGLQRKILSRFDQLFVQNQESFELMEKIGLAEICSVSGDTRFDRVMEIAGKSEALPVIKQFIGDQQAIIAGSTWPEDETIIQKANMQLTDKKLKWIIAPHEISDKHLAFLKKLFPSAVLYSSFNQEPRRNSSIDKSPKGKYPLAPADATVLIIDNIGLLSRLYRYAFITYVGGGFRPMGVHNVLEAAVYQKPVLFGPYYQKYTEAVELVRSGGGLSFTDEDKNGQVLQELIRGLIGNPEEYAYFSEKAGAFVRSNQGATQRIMDHIQEKRLLTN